MKFKKKDIARWIEGYFYSPSYFQKTLSIMLFPLSLIYCLISSLKKLICFKKEEDVPIISVGNLIVGGAGKTPIIKELAKRYEDSFVILRGYKRESKGLFFVSKKGDILVDVDKSGDEAMEIAKELKDSSVIVCENKIEAVKFAKKNGAKVIFLDDAFHKCIKKYDILIDVNIKNRFCLPSGPYRLPFFFKKFADLVIKEDRDFKRVVTIKNPTKKMVLLTSIANPKRLDRFLPKNIEKIYFEDHHNFTYDEIYAIYQKYKPTSFLVTRKDLVKLEKFDFNYSILELKIELKPKVLEKVESYIKEFYAKKNTDS